jgi:hypothetical protein
MRAENVERIAQLGKRFPEPAAMLTRARRCGKLQAARYRRQSERQAGNGGTEG